MIKKPDWIKKNVTKNGKFQTAPISLTLDQEIDFHLDSIRVKKNNKDFTASRLIREFVCVKSGKDIGQVERYLANKVIELVTLDSRFVSKDFRIFCIQKIMDNTDNVRVKERMVEKLKEESEQNIKKSEEDK